MTFLPVLLFWLACGLMSVLSREDRAYSRTYFFKASGIAVFLALLYWSYRVLASREQALLLPVAVGFGIIGVALSIRFWISLVGDFYESSRSTMMGDRDLKVEKTYDLARKAEKEGDLEGAGRRYAVEIERDRSDPEPFRQLAAIRLRQGRAEEAMALLREAMPLVRDPEDHATMAFRLSDLLTGTGRISEAREILAGVEREFAGTRFAQYAKERRERLDSPPSNPITPG
jgi:tetratricopeptide (TPR) repeat protein